MRFSNLMAISGAFFGELAFRWLILLLGLLPFGAAAQGKPQEKGEKPAGFCQPATRAYKIHDKWSSTYQLNKDSIIACRLLSRLSSRDRSGKNVIRPGTTFNAYVSQAVTDEKGMLLIPRNSEIEAQIERVYPPGKRGQPAMLEVSFNTLRRRIVDNAVTIDREDLPKNLNNKDRNTQGQYYDEVQLNGEMVSLNQKRGCNEINDDGLLVGRRPGAKNTLKYVGAGAGGGAMLAGIAVGSLTATGIGAGVGAGVGLLIALNTRGKEITLEAGTLFGVRLTTPLRLRSMEQELRYPPPKKNNASNNNPGGLTAKERELLGQIDFGLSRIITTHRQYLDTFNQPFSNSLQSLEQLQRHVREARNARGRGAALTGIARVYDASGLTHHAINRESGQATGLLEENHVTWRNTESKIIKLAEDAKLIGRR